jgi:hypothetical protein
MECSWSKVTGSNQVFQGQWSSSFTCNGTSNGLSTGAKAGIGVGAGIGGVATIAVVIAFCYKRHIKAAVREVPPEMDGQAMQARGPTRAERSEGPVFEAHGEHSNEKGAVSIELDSMSHSTEILA